MHCQRLVKSVRSNEALLVYGANVTQQVGETFSMKVLSSRRHKSVIWFSVESELRYGYIQLS